VPAAPERAVEVHAVEVRRHQPRQHLLYERRRVRARRLHGPLHGAGAGPAARDLQVATHELAAVQLERLGGACETASPRWCCFRRVEQGCGGGTNKACCHLPQWRS
jgi:hypothetical protein